MPAHRMILAEYLRARRAMLTPEDVGLPADSSRRVPGLRREEIAQLAGISLEYYVRLEQGRDHQISEQVLASLSRALQLDENGRTYFYRLALPSPLAPVDRRPAREISEAVIDLLEMWSDTPAYVFDRNQDIVFANDLATVLSPGYIVPGNNLVTMLFSTDAAGRESEKWLSTARASVAALRFASDPSDPRLQEIVGTLSVRDLDFRRMWAFHEARPLTAGLAPNYVEGFGWVDLRWQVLEVPEGHFMNVTLAEPGTPAGEAIRYLSAMLRSESFGAAAPAARVDPRVA